MRRGGELAKAIAAGADALMLGSPLARASEAPGRGVNWGMAAPSPVLPRGTRIKVGTVGLAREDPVRPGDGQRRLAEPRRRAPPVDGRARRPHPARSPGRGAGLRPGRRDRGQVLARQRARRPGRSGRVGEQLAGWGKVVRLELRGRISGAPLRVAVGYLEAPDGSLLVAAGDPDADWARNLEADPHGRATIGDAASTSSVSVRGRRDGPGRGRADPEVRHLGRATRARAGLPAAARGGLSDASRRAVRPALPSPRPGVWSRS